MEWLLDVSSCTRRLLLERSFHISAASWGDRPWRVHALAGLSLQGIPQLAGKLFETMSRPVTSHPDRVHDNLRDRDLICTGVSVIVLLIHQGDVLRARAGLLLFHCHAYACSRMVLPTTQTPALQSTLHPEVTRKISPGACSNLYLARTGNQTRLWH